MRRVARRVLLTRKKHFAIRGIRVATLWQDVQAHAAAHRGGDAGGLSLPGTFIDAGCDLIRHYAGWFDRRRLLRDAIESSRRATGNELAAQTTHLAMRRSRTFLRNETLAAAERSATQFIFFIYLQVRHEDF